MSRARVRRRWQDSYACRRQFFLFLFFCLFLVGLFKVLKIVHEDEHRKEFHRSVGDGLDKILIYLNKEGEDP